MKKLFFLLLFGWFAQSLSAQYVILDPQNFTEEINPNNSNFQFMSRINGVWRRGSFDNVKAAMQIMVQPTPITYTPTATGNSLNLGQIVQTQNNDVWFIDSDGDALRLNGSATSVDNFVRKISAPDSVCVVTGTDSLCAYAPLSGGGGTNDYNALINKPPNIDEDATDDQTLDNLQQVVRSTGLAESTKYPSETAVRQALEAVINNVNFFRIDSAVCFSYEQFGVFDTICQVDSTGGVTQCEKLATSNYLLSINGQSNGFGQARTGDALTEIGIDTTKLYSRVKILDWYTGNFETLNFGKNQSYTEYNSRRNYGIEILAAEWFEANTAETDTLFVVKTARGGARQEEYAYENFLGYEFEQKVMFPSLEKLIDEKGYLQTLSINLIGESAANVSQSTSDFLQISRDWEQLLFKNTGIRFFANNHLAAGNYNTPAGLAINAAKDLLGERENYISVPGSDFATTDGTHTSGDGFESLWNAIIDSTCFTGFGNIITKDDVNLESCYEPADYSYSNETLPYADTTNSIFTAFRGEIEARTQAGKTRLRAQNSFRNNIANTFRTEFSAPNRMFRFNEIPYQYEGESTLAFELYSNTENPVEIIGRSRINFQLGSAGGQGDLGQTGISCEFDMVNDSVKVYRYFDGNRTMIEGFDYTLNTATEYDFVVTFSEDQLVVKDSAAWTQTVSIPAADRFPNGSMFLKYSTTTNSTYLADIQVIQNEDDPAYQYCNSGGAASIVAVRDTVQKGSFIGQEDGDVFDNLQTQINAQTGDGNGILDPANDGGTIPAQFDITLTDLIRFNGTFFRISPGGNYVAVGTRTSDLFNVSGGFISSEGIKIYPSLAEATGGAYGIVGNTIGGGAALPFSQPRNLVFKTDANAPRGIYLVDGQTNNPLFSSASAKNESYVDFEVKGDYFSDDDSKVGNVYFSKLADYFGFDAAGNMSVSKAANINFDEIDINILGTAYIRSGLSLTDSAFFALKKTFLPEVGTPDGALSIDKDGQLNNYQNGEWLPVKGRHQTRMAWGQNATAQTIDATNTWEGIESQGFVNYNKVGIINSSVTGGNIRINYNGIPQYITVECTATVQSTSMAKDIKFGFGLNSDTPVAGSQTNQWFAVANANQNVTWSWDFLMNGTTDAIHPVVATSSSAPTDIVIYNLNCISRN